MKFKEGDLVVRVTPNGVIKVGESVAILRQGEDDGCYWVVDPNDSQEMVIEGKNYVLESVYKSPLYQALL